MAVSLHTTKPANKEISASDAVLPAGENGDRFWEIVSVPEVFSSMEVNKVYSDPLPIQECFNLTASATPFSHSKAIIQVFRD